MVSTETRSVIFMKFYFNEVDCFNYQMLHKLIFLKPVSTAHKKAKTFKAITVTVTDTKIGLLLKGKGETVTDLEQHRRTRFRRNSRFVFVPFLCLYNIYVLTVCVCVMQ